MSAASPKSSVDTPSSSTLQPRTLPRLHSPPAIAQLIGPFNSVDDPMRQRIPPIKSPPTIMPLPLPKVSRKSLSPSLSATIRADYSTSTPHINRHLSLRSPAEVFHSSAPTRKQEPPLSPTLSEASSASAPDSNSMAIDSGASSNATAPPLQDTDVLHQIISADGHYIRPEIHARIDKGFFLSDDNWTCYRRNYFSVVVSYSLLPNTYTQPVYLRRANGQTEHIAGFAVKISAAVDGVGGKPVDLVQHTPKRDKGPQLQPQLIRLNPRSAALQHSSRTGVSSDYDFTFNSPLINQQQTSYLYDRIQFKSATANNGKRRAAQQYYHLIVELFADINPPPTSITDGYNYESSWIKIAHRVSAPMVVRGRSPGHYVEERNKPRPASTGPEPVSNTALSISQLQHPSSHHTQSHHSLHSYTASPLNTHEHHYYHKSSFSSNASEHQEQLLTPALTDSDNQALNPPNTAYAYYPSPLNNTTTSEQNNHILSYFPAPHADDRKLYPHIGSSHYHDHSYIPPGTPSRSRSLKQEDAYYSWFPPVREEQQRMERLRTISKYHHTDSSATLYPLI